MAGWHSLSGYLYFRPGGALGKLKSRKRLWWLFEETQCQLLYYKCQEDARSKEPLGTINIQGAAISLSLGENNQFVILSDSKEFIFTAENHESMMIWLMGLQAKRDSYAAKRKADLSQTRPSLMSRPRSRSTPIVEEVDMAESRIAAYGRNRRASLQTTSLEFCRQQRLVRRLGDSMDAGLDMFSEQNFCEGENVMARSLVDLRDTALTTIPGEQHSSGTDNEAGSATDEVFTTSEDGNIISVKQKSRPHIRKMQSDITDSKVAAMYQEDNIGSLSGRSASSDSALDHGSESELTCRLSEMEQELINVKCELAIMKNRETCYKSVLEKRDSVIVELDEKLEQVQGAQGDKKLMDKQLKEDIRVLQNQNRFLNEEIRKLARLQYQEKDKSQKVQDNVKGLEADIERWKRDYLMLLQSSITVPTGDLMDGLEVKLYGGSRHRDRIQELLEEARVSNPGLPTFDKIAKSEVHVDQYGFKHAHNNEGLLLHYISTQLNAHYNMQVSSYEDHVAHWKEILAKAKPSLVKTKELKTLCRQGIPPQFRKEVWRHLVQNQVRDIMDEKGPHYFSNLCNSSHDSEFAGRYRKQISLDLLRTMPNNVKFNSTNSEGTRKLQQVLQALCIHNSNVGYCQGMNFLAGMCLLFLDTEDAFWTLIAITEKYFATNYFDQFLSGAQADQEVLKDLMREKLPTLAEHLDQIDIEISTVTLNWFLAVFFDGVPFETLIRVWDCFLLEGPKVLFRFALAILKIHEAGILQKRDTIGIMRHLKSCARLTYDVEGLVRVAFEELHPFPRRRDIAAKQVVYLNTLKEKLRRREHLRRAFVEKEERFRELDLVPSNALVFECAASYADGLLWVCYGAQNCGKVCLVNAHESLMHDLDLELDSRILSICPMSQDLLLLGTLSWNLIAFSTRNRQALWSIRLHDTVLGLCCHLEEMHGNKVFAALADGTVAVLENVGESEPNDDPFYIPVGRCPVTSMALIDNQLWCACGNNVHILHAETLDTMDRFTVSNNPFDQILCLAHCEDGVWIAVKGSSIIELWDHRQLNCKMLYDVKENKHPTNRKEEEGCLNHYRITTLLPYKGTVWIGTGDGNLIIFDIVNHPQEQSGNCSAVTSPSQRGRLERRNKVCVDAEEDEGIVINCDRKDKEKSRSKKSSSSSKSKSGSKPRRKSEGDVSGNEKCKSDSFEAEEQGNDVESASSSQSMSATSSNNDLAKDARKSSSSISEGHSSSSRRKKTDGTRACCDSKDGTATSKERSKQSSSSQNRKRSEEKDERKSRSKSNGETTRRRHRRTEVDDENVIHSKDMRKSSRKIEENCDVPEKQKIKSKSSRTCEINDMENEKECREKMSGSDRLKVRGSQKSKSRKVSEKSEKDARTDKPRKVRSSRKREDSESNNNDQSNKVIEDETSSQGNREETGHEVVKTNEGVKTNVKVNNVDMEDPLLLDGIVLEVNENNNYVPCCTNSPVNDNGIVHVEIIENSLRSNTNCKMGDLNAIPKIHSEESACQKEKGLSHSQDNETVLSQVLKRAHEKRPLPPEESLVTGETSLLSAKDSFLQTLSPISESVDGLGAENEEVEESVVVSENPILNVQPPAVPDVYILSVDTAAANDGVLLAPQLSPISEGTESVSGQASPADWSDSPSQGNRGNTLSPTNFARCVDQKLKNLSKDPEKKCKPKTPSNTPELCQKLEVNGSTWSTTGEVCANELHRLLKKEKDAQDVQASGSGGGGQHLDVEAGGTASSASNSSLFTDIQYSCELSLQARIKISDKPIRCLVLTKLREEPIILSCSGCYGDDEAVLKWTKEPEEKLWTNEPIFELCPITNRPKTPLYMKQISPTLSQCFGSSESLRTMSSSSRRPLLMPQASMPNDL